MAEEKKIQINQKNSGSNSTPDDEKNTSEKKMSSQERADFLGVPFLAKAPRKISKKAISVIPEESARKYQMVVFEKGNKDGKSYINVAMRDPQDIDALNVLRFVSQNSDVEVGIYLAPKEVVDELLREYSTTEKAVEAVIDSFGSDDEYKEGKTKISEGKNSQQIIQDAPVSKLVRVIIRHAFDGKASDIHIEPYEDEYRVRFRVDGLLHSSLAIPNEVGKAIVSRIKILASLKIDEKRKPQDGRFTISDKDVDTDFRVSTLPVVGGEKVVMRVLSKEGGAFSLDNLGVVGRNKNVFQEAIKDTHGIILMTGPTGSGKSTTLYALLQIINEDERNIVTLEDPVEYSIDGINQSQIKPEIGYTFASGLRSILRQDPNVIMVGEIRDTETAELAIHAALTGHLVLSTLHTNSAVGALPRLVDMGVEPFLLSSSLRVLAAQRLVRKICQHCRVEDKLPNRMMEKIKSEIKSIPEKEFKEYGVDISKELKFYKGKGCEECNGLGLKGRVAMYECIEIDDEIKHSLGEGKEVTLKEIVERQGILTMKQDGILKALQGVTTISEVARITEGNFAIGGDLGDDRG